MNEEMIDKMIDKIEQKIISYQDLEYREFQAKLTPSISKDSLIGVRNPDVKKIAKEIIKNGEDDLFINSLPHRYYEENNLHSYIISECKDYDKTIKLLDEFLPYVDNWATCDIIVPKVFKKNLDKLFKEINRWIKSDKTYSIRFGIKMLMSFYLDESFKKEYLNIPLEIKSDEYYVNMMIAWYYSTALVKQYEDTIKIIENKKLDKWIHNKSIQKAIESFRISEDKKEYLRNLKIK